MYMSRNNRNRNRFRQNITIDDLNFKSVSEFKYLGITVTEENYGSQEINNWIQAEKTVLTISKTS